MFLFLDRFIVCEIKAREHELLKLSVKSDITIYNTSSSASLTVGLFGKLFLAK